MTSRGIAALYSDAVESFVEFARTLTADDWATPVPCSPLWTARDVLSHVAGIPDDALAGRMDDPASERWTAEQVERNRDADVDELLDRWLSQYEGFGQMAESIGEQRPPYDCHTHEHDVRQALGRPGNRSGPIIDGAFDLLGHVAGGRGLPVALDIIVEGEVRPIGDRASGRSVTLTTTKFEVFRSRLGRRSREQVLAYDWTGSDGDVEAVVDRWFNFGPSEQPIDE